MNEDVYIYIFPIETWRIFQVMLVFKGVKSVFGLFEMLGFHFLAVKPHLKLHGNPIRELKFHFAAFNLSKFHWQVFFWGVG